MCNANHWSRQKAYINGCRWRFAWIIHCNCAFTELFGSSVHFRVSLLADCMTAGFRIDDMFNVFFCVNAGITQTSGQACRSDTCVLSTVARVSTICRCRVSRLKSGCSLLSVASFLFVCFFGASCVNVFYFVLHDCCWIMSYCTPPCP